MLNSREKRGLKMFYRYGGGNNDSKPPSEIFDKATTRGTDPSVPHKIECLKEKWKTKKYCQIGEETTLMHALLFRQVQPIHTAVLWDNVNYFRENCFPEAMQSYLIEACLCGSRQVAEYVLATLGIDYKERPDLLGYIAASVNDEWIRDVACEMAKERLSMPSNVYRLSDPAVRDTIIAIFNSVISRSELK
jgi:hypothetical protein